MTSTTTKPPVITPSWIPPDVDTRVCDTCHYRLTLEYFSLFRNGKRGKTCICCRDAKQEAKPWTQEQTLRLKAAARDVMDLWVVYMDMLTEDDRVKLRELLAAVDRVKFIGGAEDGG